MKKILLLSAISLLAVTGFAYVSTAINNDVALETVPADNTVTESDNNFNPLKFVRHGNRVVALPNAEDEGLPGALFTRPTGVFYCGVSTANSTFTNNRMYGPSFRNLQFVNRTTDATSMFWSFTNPDDLSEIITSTANNLSVFYHDYATVDAPALTASNIQGDSTYTLAPYIQVGGPCYVNSSGTVFPAANYNPAHWTGNSYNSGISGNNNAKADSYYTKKVKDAGGVGFDVDTVRVLGFAELNDKPLSPYLLKTVYSRILCHESGELACRIYRATRDANGNYGLGELLSEQFAEVTSNGNTTVTVAFEDLQGRDKETGLDVELVIDDAIVTVIEANDDNVTFFPLYKPHTEYLPNEHHAFTFVEISNADGSQTKQDIINTNLVWTTSGNRLTSWQNGYDIANYYLHSETDTIKAPAEGIEQDIEFRSYYSSARWYIEKSDGADWVTVGEPVDSIVEETNRYSGHTKLNIAVDPLPEGVNLREADVTVSYPGAEFVVHVKQEAGSTPGILGDLNGDGNVNTGDVSTLYTALLNGATDPKYDLNGDGNVNTGDVSTLYAIILGQ